MKLGWVAAGMMFGTVSAHAAGVDIAYENFYLDPDMGRARAILKVTNNTNETIKTAIIECAFLNSGGRALDTAILIASNVRPSQDAYVDGWSAQMDGIEKLTCRLKSAR